MFRLLSNLSSSTSFESSSNNRDSPKPQNESDDELMIENTYPNCIDLTINDGELPLSHFESNSSVNSDENMTYNSTNSSSTNNSQISNLLDLMNNLRFSLNPYSWENKLCKHYASSLSADDKDEHFKQLEYMMVNKQIACNNMTLTETYIPFFQRSIRSECLSSPYLKGDPDHVNDFNDSMAKFRNEIHDIQTLTLKAKIDNIDSEINKKIAIISIFDDKAKEKVEILSDRIKKNYSFD